MPLPTAPTRRPNNPGTRRLDKKASSSLLLNGLLSLLIGLCALLSPYAITSAGMQNFVAPALVIGWLSLVPGCVFLGLYLKRRISAPAKP